MISADADAGLLATLQPLSDRCLSVQNLPAGFRPRWTNPQKVPAIRGPSRNTQLLAKRFLIEIIMQGRISVGSGEYVAHGFHCRANTSKVQLEFLGGLQIHSGTGEELRPAAALGTGSRVFAAGDQT